MPASLTSVEECLQVSGAHHITISPPLLAALAATPAPAASSSTEAPLFFDEAVDDAEVEGDAALIELVKDEAKYRIRYTRLKNGAAEKKIVDAVNIFADCQDATEELIRRYVK
jgi:transaldolase